MNAAVNLQLKEATRSEALVVPRIAIGYLGYSA